MQHPHLSLAIIKPCVLIIALGASAATLMIAAPGGAAASNAVLKCGSVTVQVPSSRAGHTKPFPYVDITASGVSCQYAKAFVRKLNTGSGRPPSGWKSGNGRTVSGRYPVEAVWRHGKSTITYRYSCEGC